MKIMLKCQTIDFMILLHNKYDYAFCQGIYAGTLLLYAQEIAMNHLWSQVGITELCKIVVLVVFTSSIQVDDCCGLM